MMVDYNAMALFVKVAECNSFSEASNQTGIAVSTVSRRISQLEKTLSVRLLERSTRNLRLTLLGRDYFQYCKRAVKELEAANLMLNNSREEVSGILRLSVPPSLEKCLVLPLITRFQDQYPKARIKIWVTDRKLNFIDDGVDIAFRVGELDDSNLIARRLISYRHILVASPDYLNQSSALPLQHPRDLQHHRLMGYGDWFNETTWTFSQGDKVERVVAEHTFAINDFNGILIALEAGRGISELPSIMCKNELQQGKLIEVLPDWHFGYTANGQFPLSAVYPSNRNLSHLVIAFKDFCVENIESIVNPNN